MKRKHFSMFYDLLKIHQIQTRDGLGDAWRLKNPEYLAYFGLMHCIFFLRQRSIPSIILLSKDENVHNVQMKFIKWMACKKWTVKHLLYWIPMTKWSYRTWSLVGNTKTCIPIRSAMQYEKCGSILKHFIDRAFIVRFNKNEFRQKWMMRCNLFGSWNIGLDSVYLMKDIIIMLWFIYRNLFFTLYSREINKWILVIVWVLQHLVLLK